jgi:hypothetical protein
MIEPRLFQSCARTERHVADIFYLTLAEQGCSVWVDRKAIFAADDSLGSLPTEDPI